MKFNIPVSSPLIGEEEAQAVYEVVKGGWVSMGETVSKFESEFAEYVGAKHAISTINGTAALHLAVLAAEIKEGDEVLVPDITFISTANTVMYERAEAIIIECDELTYNLSLEDAKKRITDKTKVIIPVDMNGLPVDYDAVFAFARDNGLKVISDSAESLGAEYKDQKVGSLAWLHIFSFFPNKNMTTGEGGMVTTSDDDSAKLIRELRNQGQDYRYNHIHLGFNYRMTNVTAAIGRVQLKRLNSIWDKKNNIAAKYAQAFSNEKCFSAPHIPDYVSKPSWYMYPIKVEEHIDRDKVVYELAARGIDTRLSFPPIHIQPYYMKKFGYTESTYPLSYKAWKSKIDLPIGPTLTDEEQDYVIDNVIDVINKLS